MLYGYARVSTTDQDVSIQEAALRAFGCEIIRSEKKSGKSRENREELKILLEFLRPGDTLVVTRIDRLARSLKDFQDLIYMLKDKKVALKVIEQPIDTETSGGKAFLNMLAVFAEFETDLRKERQLEGIAKAKAEGVYKGMPQVIDRKEVKRLKAEGKKEAQIAKLMKIGRASVYRILNEEKEINVPESVE